MKTRLLTLIDFSSYSVGLLKLANAWSEKNGAEIVLIHWVNSDKTDTPDPAIPEKVFQQKKDKTYSALNNLAKEHLSNHLTSSVRVLFNDPWQSLAEIQTKDCNNIILAGLKGTRNIENRPMGNTAFYVTNKLNCLVLIIPLKINFSLPKSLTVLLSCRSPLNKLEFNRFLDAASLVTDHIRFISLISHDNKYKRCHQYLLNLSMEYNHRLSAEFEVFEGKSSYNQIKDYIAELPETMMVVQKEENFFPDKDYRNFLIQDLVVNKSLPLVVIPR